MYSRERPIVLVAKASGYALSPLIAPGIPDIGIMLPTTRFSIFFWVWPEKLRARRCWS